MVIIMIKDFKSNKTAEDFIKLPDGHWFRKWTIF